MAPKNPIGKLADHAVKAIKDPRKTAEMVVEQAKGTAALGRMVAEQVGRSAVSKAGQTAGAVVARAPGRKPSPTPKRGADAPRAESPTPLRAVPRVDEAGPPPDESQFSGPVKEAPAKKAPAKKAPADKAPAKKAPAKKAPADKAPAKKAPAKKATPSPADVAGVMQAAVARDQNRDGAPAAKKGAVTKAAIEPPAEESTPGGKLPVKKAAKKATTTPVPEVPADPAGTRPADASPDRPADTRPDRPADTRPDRPADTRPDRPADTSPADTRPDRPADTSPADTRPDRPADTSPADTRPDQP